MTQTIPTGPPTQPWGTPPPPKPPGKPIYKRGWFWPLVVVVAFGLGFAACVAVVGTAVNDAANEVSRGVQPAATTIGPGDTGPTTDTEPSATEAPSGPPVVSVGDTLEMTNGFGDTVAEITVGGPTSPSNHKGMRFSTGDEFNTPEHGLWMGAWVKVKALEDGVDTVYGDLHVSQGGHHYSGDACCPDGFEPTLDYATLSKGEKAEGWVIFDIRSRHGEIVIADYDGKRLGAWKF